MTACSTTLSLEDKATHLGNLLADQLATCADLEKVLREKQDCLVQHRLERLQELSERERQLAHSLGNLETHRLQVSHELSGLLGLEADSQLSVQISALTDTDTRYGLSTLARALGSKLVLLNKLNEDNRILAHNLLEYTGMVLRLLAHGHNNTAYGSDGRMSGGAPRAMLDNRI